LDGFLTVPSSSSSLKIYTHFLEILSSEYFRTCLNCYVLSATLLVHDPIAPCLDYGNRLLVSSLLVCSNCYFPYATILRVLNDFLKVWSGADSHWWPLRSTIHRFRLVYTTKYITLPKHTLFQTGYFPHYYYHSLGILSYMTLTKPIFSVKINPSTHPSIHTYIPSHLPVYPSSQPGSQKAHLLGRGPHTVLDVRNTDWNTGLSSGCSQSSWEIKTS